MVVMVVGLTWITDEASAFPGKEKELPPSNPLFPFYLIFSAQLLNTTDF